MFFDNLFDNFNPFGRYSYREPRPQTSSLFRNDNNSIIIRKILNDEYNYMCFDCHREIDYLNYFDLKNGIFLCYNCAQQHAKLSKEITQPMTGSIRQLEEKDLLILYYGGNKNLLDFIRRHFPLLENMKPNDMYATKAMEYYRKLLISKAFKEREPVMPGRKKAYTSIFQKQLSPSKGEQINNNIREKRIKESLNKDNDEDHCFNNTFFGDDLYNRNRQNQRKNNYVKREENNNIKTEPAVINKKENEENDDAGMKIEKGNNNHNYKNEENEQKNKKYEPKYKKIEKKENKGNNIKVNTININQIGELSRYPDAMEIDGMDC